MNMTVTLPVQGCPKHMHLLLLSGAQVTKSEIKHPLRTHATEVVEERTQGEKGLLLIPMMKGDASPRVTEQKGQTVERDPPPVQGVIMIDTGRTIIAEVGEIHPVRDQ